jgi:NADPH-dependent 2,4-dienoyl-CoA reductase/sulfur reductase-like enzyme
MRIYLYNPSVHDQACPRSRSRTAAAKNDGTYDVVVIGAGCIGGAIARELSKHKLSVLVVEGTFIANYQYAWMCVDVC